MSDKPTPVDNAMNAVKDELDTKTSSQKALMRLALSRELLREALIPPRTESSDTQGGDRRTQSLLHRVESGLRQWRKKSSPLGAVSLALSALSWMGSSGDARRRSPPRGNAAPQPAPPKLPHDGVISLLGPYVREHPWTSLGLAVGLGACLPLVRPWRWGVVRMGLRVARMQATDTLLTWLVRQPMQTHLLRNTSQVTDAQ